MDECMNRSKEDRRLENGDRKEKRFFAGQGSNRNQQFNRRVTDYLLDFYFLLI